jgi:hypothetical protein
VDVRIEAISDALGLSFASYAEHESFYLGIAKEVELNGWELDRLLFNFRPQIESGLCPREPATCSATDQGSLDLRTSIGAGAMAHSIQPPSWADTLDHLRAAIRQVEARDAYLLCQGLNERTISHRLALYLTSEFPEWDVDCEYNRSGGQPKTLRLPAGRVSWEDTNAKTVFPDIIVHRRGLDGPNLLVIKMKKSGLPAGFDHQKLKAYKSGHKYQYAVFVRVRVGDKPGFDVPYEIDDGEATACS